MFCLRESVLPSLLWGESRSTELLVHPHIKSHAQKCYTYNQMRQRRIIICSLVRPTVIKGLVKAHLANLRQNWELQLNLSNFGLRAGLQKSCAPWLYIATFATGLTLLPAHPRQLRQFSSTPALKEMNKCTDKNKITFTLLPKL